MALLYKVIFRLLLSVDEAVLKSTSPVPHNLVEEEPSDDELRRISEEFASILSQAGVEVPHNKQQGLIAPFEVHMAKHFTPEMAESSSAFIEGMLSALTDLAEEIRTILPDSTISTSIDRKDTPKHRVFKGYLSWKLDSVNQMVYPISIGLLRDGFIYESASNSYVITVKVEK